MAWPDASEDVILDLFYSFLFIYILSNIFEELAGITDRSSVVPVGRRDGVAALLEVCIGVLQIQPVYRRRPPRRRRGRATRSGRPPQMIHRVA